MSRGALNSARNTLNRCCSAEMEGSKVQLGKGGVYRRSVNLTSSSDGDAGGMKNVGLWVGRLRESQTGRKVLLKRPHLKLCIVHHYSYMQIMAGNSKEKIELLPIGEKSIKESDVPAGQSRKDTCTCSKNIARGRC